MNHLKAKTLKPYSTQKPGFKTQPPRETRRRDPLKEPLKDPLEELLKHPLKETLKEPLEETP